MATAPLRAVRFAGRDLAAVLLEPRRDRVVFRAFRSVKSPARALRRGLARALLRMAHSKTPPERGAAGL